MSEDPYVSAPVHHMVSLRRHYSLVLLASLMALLCQRIAVLNIAVGFNAVVWLLAIATITVEIRHHKRTKPRDP